MQQQQRAGFAKERQGGRADAESRRGARSRRKVPQVARGVRRAVGDRDANNAVQVVVGERAGERRPEEQRRTEQQNESETEVTR